MAAVAALVVVVPLATGTFAWRRGIAPRFGMLLILVGAGSFLATLSNSDSSLLYSVGRVSGWLLEPLIVYTLLAYPNGRLEGTIEKAVVAAAAMITAGLYLPSALLVADYPTPSVWTTCTSDCPPNAFMATGQEPGLIDVLVPLREVLTVGVFIATASLLALRVRRATPLNRAVLSPVLNVAVVRFLLLGATLALRGSGAAPDVAQVGAIATILALPLISVGFLIGLLRRRVHTARALERINGGVGESAPPSELEALLGESLGDPSLRLYLARPDGGWQDARGRTVDRPADTPGRMIEEVAGREGSPVALLACDDGIRSQPTELEAAAGSVRSTLERQSLAKELRSSLRDVAASRARLTAAADVERRRIERDLHDGAQQRLIALRVRLGLAEEAFAEDPEEALRLMHELGPQVEAVIDDVRSLSQGIYPALLTDAGPGEALRAAALRSPLRVSIFAPGLERQSPEVESAVYFCCLEAIQNANKHATGATGIEVRIANGGKRLEFEVRDDGGGFRAGGNGMSGGLTNMRDRVAAVGGRLRIHSAPGSGTAVAGSIPVPGA
jgi:signal transduction histidine kinase